MKAYRKVLSAVFLIAAVAFTAYNLYAQGKTYKVGDRGPGGGWVIYDKGKVSDGWRYLEAAPVDQYSAAEWGCYKESIFGARGTAIGTGKNNTQAIVASCLQGANIAARLCTDYRGGGKSDWFLPSKDELNLLYKVLCEKGVGGFADDYYWSSSELAADFAWYQFFKNGYQHSYNKYVDIHVRAVRSF
jgi:hypothetical protein